MYGVQKIREQFLTDAQLVTYERLNRDTYSY